MTEKRLPIPLFYGAFAVLMIGCGATRPSNLGVVDGKLAPCPSAPHCVSTQATEDGHATAAIPYEASREQARKRLAEIIRSMPRAAIVTDAPDYIHAEFRSRIFGYVDDVEVYLDDRAKLAHLRSSSRQGYYDFGANKSRVEKIRQQFLAGKS